MSFFIGRDREARRAYGFDEVAIVPGMMTVDPEDTNTETVIGPLKFKIPFVASAMDGTVDVKFAVAMGKLGGLAVLNLEGLHTRYESPEEAYSEIAKATPESAPKILQKIYSQPIQESLISRRIQEIKKGGAAAAVSCVPKNAAHFGAVAAKAGADVLVVQGTVATARYESSRGKPLDLGRLCKELKIPVIIGNVVTHTAALELMETGCAGILVGVGPGAACTSRGVLGIGVPQITSTVDCAAARDYFFKKTGRYVSIITDGGMTNSGDVCKAFTAGADLVMMGSTFARAKEAPGRGYHWGMAMPDRYLPRGTRIHVGTTSTLEEILFGPATQEEGLQNFVGALRTCMGYVGARTIRELQLAEIIIAPEIKHEGKLFQQAQRVGMGKK
ncbi:MAG TPA: GuaB3 family IMP dehydrogenase-related protein [Elusimicrobiota bacterium]|nr:GuaB3 family IMP dehydrogenase-related protein [Elusimicrobiota bacterium]